MLAVGTSPPMPVSDSIAPLTAPHEATVVTTAHSAVEATPKRCSLPSMLKPWTPAASIAGVAWFSAIATTTTPTTNSASMAAVDRPALAPVADHPAVDGGQRRRDREDQQQLDEVREPGRVLERMRGVDVEEAAAVGAELLDDLLRGDRAGAQRLDDALRDEDQADDDRDRQQHVDERLDEVAVEVADRPARARGERPDEGDRDGDADGRRDEVLDGQAGHLLQSSRASSRPRRTASSCS